MPSLSTESYADPKVMQNPFPYFERLRAEDPVHYDAGIKTWLITRHDDILAAARDTEGLSDQMRVSEAIRSPFQNEADVYMVNEGFYLLDTADSFKVDGELHARRRALVAHAFSPRAVSSMEARVVTIVRERVAALLHGGQVDLVREYAMQIPILVICDALGLPMDHVDDISRAADSMVARAGAGATREQAFQHARNLIQLQRLIKVAITERRAKPANDLISQIVHARIDDPNLPPLTDKEIVAICAVAVAGGADTTRNSIAYGLLTLATSPDLVTRLRESPQQDKEIARFNEEVLRFHSTVPQLPRVATRDTVIAGKTIPKGAFVMLCWASGNRDPQRFENADTFDMDRPGLSNHLALGTGVHYCLGAFLARQEMKWAIKELVNHVESLELAVDPKDLDLSTSMPILRTLKSLPVRLRKRAARENAALSS
jgi:cytochrome P450